ncbi:hypothetical protein MHI01_22990 [Paenibacillus sp. FSL M7-0656]|uniref:hypothetical protein n=1 Tax=Paenibacillus sp. FSL M7-0656 TaxID=2921534 RepID=UPI0030F7D4D2
MSRVSKWLIVSLVSIFILSMSQFTVSASTSITQTAQNAERSISSTDRVQHNIRFAIRGTEVTVTTLRTSFDTGELKENEYHFTDPAILPRIHTGLTTTSHQYDPIVSDTPAGLKGYITYYATDDKQHYYVLYEYDYSSNTLRKVHEGENRIHLEPQIGIYYTIYEKNVPKSNYYSMVTGKKVYTRGKLLLERDFTDTKYVVSPIPQTRNFGVYCTDTLDCHYLEYGGIKGKKAKVSDLWMKPDQKTGLSTKAFQVSADVHLNVSQGNTRDRKSDWTVVVTKNGKKTTLIKERVGYVQSFISPERKTLVLVTENGLDSKMESSKVQVYDLKTLKRIRSYDSPYRARTESIQWITEDEYIIEQYFSNPGSYPPSLYVISENKHLKLNYGTYSDWKKYWNSFQFSNVFFPMEPVAIKSDQGVLEYKGQPTFYMEGQHYVPLEEFTKAFHIQYNLGKDRLTFTRGQRSSSVNQPSKQLLTLYNQTFIPLGQWSKDLGLKVSETKATGYNKQLSMSDEEKGTDLAMDSKILPFHARARWMDRVGESYQLDPVNTRPMESAVPDRIDGVVLNFDRTLTISSSKDSITELLFINPDYTSVLGKVSLTDIPERKWGFSTAKIPENMLQDGALNVIVPVKEGKSTMVYSLKLPEPFDKNKF